MASLIKILYEESYKINIGTQINATDLATNHYFDDEKIMDEKSLRPPLAT